MLADASTMAHVMEVAERVAQTDFTVLITGETGTGKDLLARCIHIHSLRADRQLIPVACAALPENLLESELFGHRRGSFTGAVTDQRGLIERAEGGTLFLDEVDALAPAMQAKLLRVVEEHCIQRIGHGHDIPVNFRLIAATNSDLEALVRDGRFRKDLYFRLSVVRIEVPPLRERPEDIPVLAMYFRDDLARETGLPLLPFSDEAMRWLCSQEWPGNVRQLKHSVERALVLSKGTDRIDAPHFDDRLPCPVIGGPASLNRALAEGWNLSKLEEEYIRAVMVHTDGHKGRAADILGIDRRTLYRRLGRMENVT